MLYFCHRDIFTIGEELFQLWSENHFFWWKFLTFFATLTLNFFRITTKSIGSSLMWYVSISQSFLSIWEKLYQLQSVNHFFSENFEHFCNLDLKLFRNYPKINRDLTFVICKHIPKFRYNPRRTFPVTVRKPFFSENF